MLLISEEEIIKKAVCNQNENEVSSCIIFIINKMHVGSKNRVGLSDWSWPPVSAIHQQSPKDGQLFQAQMINEHRSTSPSTETEER